jgi:hypothetical protein
MWLNLLLKMKKSHTLASCVFEALTFFNKIGVA